MPETHITVEVAYATKQYQKIIKIDILKGSCIQDAINQSHIEDYFNDINLNELDVGIFSQKKTLDTILNPNDRVEIYRPLQADPKEVRKAKAKKPTAN